MLGIAAADGAGVDLLLYGGDCVAERPVVALIRPDQMIRKPLGGFLAHARKVLDEPDKLLDGAQFAPSCSVFTTAAKTWKPREAAFWKP